MTRRWTRPISHEPGRNAGQREARKKVQEVLCRMPSKDQKILRAVFIEQKIKTKCAVTWA